MDYWIAIENKKTGPLPLDEVIKLPITPDTLAWRDGLPSWVPAGSIPELAEAMGWSRKPASPVPASPARMTAAAPRTNIPRHSAGEEVPPMPPTYLGWSIAAIVLCCMIPAIVALVYAIRVSSLYNSGDFAGSKKASERAELWLIIAITLGLVAMPFMIVFQMLAS